jgi:hypothetical protein
VPALRKRHPERRSAERLAHARQRAFAEPLARTKELLARYDALPEPHISVSPDQYATALSDSRVLGRSRVVLHSLHRLHEFGFNDKKTIGTTARRRLQRLVALLDEIFRATEELAWFRPPSSEVARARSAMIASARHITLVCTTLLEAVSAQTLEEVVPLQAGFQSLLSGYPFVSEFDAAFEALSDLPPGGIDERVSAAFGVEVSVTDDLGLLDPARILAAFKTDDEPFKPLAQRAATFLAHLTDIDADTIEADGVALALGGLGLAVLDRPLPAHTLARQVVDLLKKAEAVDPAATAALLGRTSDEGPRVFAAAKRIHDDLVYLVGGHARDEGDVVARMVTTYKRLAESSFRNYAWLVADAQRIAEGSSPATEPPLLGALEQRFAARDDPASKTLSRAADRLLRNAEAHEDFRIGRDGESIIVAGKRLALSRFEKRLDRLLQATLGLDAAYTCRAYETGAFDTMARWLADGDAPFATELLLRGIFEAYGLELVGIAHEGDGVRFVVEWDAPDVVRALTPLCAAATLFPTSERLRLDLVDGTSVIAVDTSAFRAFAEADEGVKDIALLEPVFSAGLDAGRDPLDLSEDVLALSIALIAATDVPRLKVALAIGNPDPLALLEKRLAFIIRFTRARTAKASPLAERALKSLSEARAASVITRRGDSGAAQRMVAALTRAASWSDARGYHWPPL